METINIVYKNYILSNPLRKLDIKYHIGKPIFFYDRQILLRIKGILLKKKFKYLLNIT